MLQTTINLSRPKVGSQRSGRSIADGLSAAGAAIDAAAIAAAGSTAASSRVRALRAQARERRAIGACDLSCPWRRSDTRDT
jgi:hypothetical protein